MKDAVPFFGCTTFQQMKAIIDDWIDHYNERYQWQPAKLSPNEYYRYINIRCLSTTCLAALIKPGLSTFLDTLQ